MIHTYYHPLELMESIATALCEGTWTIEEAEGEAEVTIRDNITMDAPDELYNHWDVCRDSASASTTNATSTSAIHWYRYIISSIL